MNCKPGDLAYIVWAKDEHYAGRFVECVSLFGLLPPSTDRGQHWWVKPLGWIPTCELHPTLGAFLFPDSALRPIRDNPGKDETLTWAPVPDKVTP